MAQFDIADNDGKVIVEQGKRINARHVRQMEAAGLTKLSVPDGNSCRVIATVWRMAENADFRCVVAMVGRRVAARRFVEIIA